MNVYLLAAAALLASLAPPAVVCARGRPIEGAIALQLCSVTTTLVLLCLTAASINTTYDVLAVVAAALSPLTGLFVARMLGHRV